MKRFIVSSACLVLALLLAQGLSLAGDGGKLSSGAGNLLRGTVYKLSGVSRDGVVTIRTDWKLPGAAPVYRYDFDILYGTIEGSLYSYQMADIAEIEFLPTEDGRQPANIKLRNGLIQKALLSTEDKGILGTVGLKIKEVDVVTDGYGDNIIPGADVQKIVFSRPPASGEADLPELVTALKKALEVGKRDGLIDKDFLAVLENIQKKAEEKLKK